MFCNFVWKTFLVFVAVVVFRVSAILIRSFMPCVDMVSSTGCSAKRLVDTDLRLAWGSGSDGS